MSIVEKALKEKSAIYEKGQVLIVGKKKGDKLITDGVVVYDSYSICKSKPMILQNGEIDLSESQYTEDIIYITGHGQKEKQTISGLTMKEIADMLIKKYHYDGTQKIVILSCYGLYEISGKNMAKLLKEELENKLNKADDKQKTENEGNTETEENNNTQNHPVVSNNKIQRTVEALAEHTTIIVEADKSNAYVYDLEVNGSGFWSFQNRFLRRIRCSNFRVEEIERYYDTYGKEVELYNSWLIVGKRVEAVMEDEFRRVIVILLILTLLIIGAGIALQLFTGCIWCVMGSIPVIIIAFIVVYKMGCKGLL